MCQQRVPSYRALAEHILKPLLSSVGTELKQSSTQCSKMFPWERQFPWERSDSASSSGLGGHGEPDGGSGDEFDPDDLSPEEAGLELMNFIVELKHRGVLKATHACILSYWASRAGAQGPVNELKKKPGMSSGNYSKHFDKVLNTKPSDSNEWYMLPTPMHLRADASRSVFDMCCIVPHETLCEEVAASPSLSGLLATAQGNRALPPSYHNHPALSEDDDRPVYPFAVYLDAIPFSRTDSALGLFIYNMISGHRHLVLAIRKSETCKCACGGWCTMRVMWEFLGWSLTALRAGVFPTTRHDRSNFHADGTDSTRSALAGDRMPFRGIVLQIKGDWQEFVSSIGFPSWASALHPCFFCHCDRNDWFGVAGLSPISTQYQLKTFAQYDEACRICEIVVHLTPDQFSQVKAGLFFDKRRNGAKGRALIFDVVGTPLRKGDRLEPSDTLRDIFLLDELTPPCTLTFWRPGAESLTKHRNPMFSILSDVTPDCIQVDWLHTLSLGIFQDFIGALVHTLVQLDVWNVGNLGVNASSRLQTSVMRMEGLLFEFYSSCSIAGEIFTQVGRLDSNMFGSPDSPSCKLYGAETNGVLAFVNRVLVPKFALQLGGQAALWARCANALWRLKELCDLPPERWTDECDQAIRFNLTQGVGSHA